MDFWSNRDFVAKNYLKVKEQNPAFPFIVRECEDADPTVMARYSINNLRLEQVWAHLWYFILGFGIEKKAFTAGLSDAEIESNFIFVAFG